MIEHKTTPATPPPTETPVPPAYTTRSQKMEALHQKTKTMLLRAIQQDNRNLRERTKPSRAPNTLQLKIKQKQHPSKLKVKKISYKDK
jgi:hypothetical protein